MNWSPEQDRALCAVKNWLDNPTQQVFRLFGYAGTGKTTLAKYLAEDVSGLVHFAAFTGKAAYVMRQKGCPNTKTIHQLIYVPSSKSKLKLIEMEEKLRQEVEHLTQNGLNTAEIDNDPKVSQLRHQIRLEVEHVRKPAFQINVDSDAHNSSLIVIDECSMVDDIIGNDLLSFKKPILVLGDPAQLPPVKGSGFFTEAQPDFLLTDIHRQARDNPIIDLATRVRTGQSLPLGTYGESRIIPWADLDGATAMGADQMIVGRNETRNKFNRKFRKNLKFEEALPQVGDKLVCLRNNHELGLLNGSTWMVREVSEKNEERIFMRIQDQDNGYETEVAAHSKIFLGQEIPWWDKTSAEEFDFGYAITCHKAQGSQWDSVLVFDESQCFRQNAQRWLYTALTRAAKRIVIVR